MLLGGGEDGHDLSRSAPFSPSARVPVTGRECSTPVRPGIAHRVGAGGLEGHITEDLGSGRVPLLHAEGGEMMRLPRCRGSSRRTRVGEPAREEHGPWRVEGQAGTA